MKKRIVLVDPDPRSQKVLEVSLVQAGYAVYTADDGDSAWALLAEDAPDLVIADTRLPKIDGYALVRKMRAKSNVAAVPVVFITHQRGVEDKIRGLELGVEEFLTKPVYANELLARVSVIFSRITSRALAAAAPVSVDVGSGKLSDIGLFDLMLTFESSRRTGSLHIEAERGPATLWFRDGRVVDAECGSLRGPDAVYRCFVWRDGTFKIDLDAVPKEETITDSADTIVTDATRRLKEWQRVTEQLPALNTVFEVDHVALLERLPEIPDEINGILRLIDGARSIWTIIDQSPFDDLSTMSTLAKLYFEGLLKPKDENAKEVHAPTAPHGTLPPVSVNRTESISPSTVAAPQNLASFAVTSNTMTSAVNAAIAATASGRSRNSDAPPASRTIVPSAVPPPQHPPATTMGAVAPGSLPPSGPPLVGSGTAKIPPLGAAGFPVKEETKDYHTVPRGGSTAPAKPSGSPPGASAADAEEWASKTIVHGSFAGAGLIAAAAAPIAVIQDDEAEGRTLKMKNPISDPAPVKPQSVPARADSKRPVGSEGDNAEATVLDAVKTGSIPPAKTASVRPESASAEMTNVNNAPSPVPDAGAAAASDDAWRASSEKHPSGRPPARASHDSGPPPSMPPTDDDDIAPPVRRIPGKYIAIPLALLLPVIAIALVASRKEVRGDHDTANGLALVPPTASATATSEPTSVTGVNAVPTLTVTTLGTTAPTATAEPIATVATTATAPPTASAHVPTVTTGAATTAPTTTAAPATTIAETNPVAAAQQYLERGNARKAVELAERATRNNPSDAEAWLTLGAAYQNMGAGGRARAAYARCAESGAGGRVAECKALLGNE